MQIINGPQLGSISDLLGQAAQGAIRTVFNSVEIKSALSQPVVYTSQDLASMIGTGGQPVRPSGGPGAATVPEVPPSPGTGSSLFSTKSLIERVKPTVVVNTRDGSRLVFAPYGEATDTEWEGNVTGLIVGTLGFLALYTAGAYYLGVKAGERKALRKR